MAKEQSPPAPAAVDSAALHEDQTKKQSDTEKNVRQPSEVEQSSGGRASGAKRKPRDNTPRSMPYLEQTVLLKSFHAQQTFRRSFPIALEALFTLSVILRALAEESECAKVDAVINEKIEVVKKSIQEEQVRLEKLGETYGIQTSGITYSAPESVTVKVTSPRAVSMTTLIRDFDRLVELFDILWLSHVINDGEYGKGIFNAKRQIRRLANDMRTLAIRSIGSAQRRGIDDVTDPRSGPLDPNTSKISVNSQDEAPESSSPQGNVELLAEAA